MSNADRYQPPSGPSAGDHALAAGRAGLGSIPLVGAVATELLNVLVTPPLERRRQTWMKEVGQGLRELEEKVGLRLEELQRDQAFVTTAVQATQAAIGNHEPEKLAALRNAVLNSALPHAPEESLRQVFLSYVNTLTVWHLRILKLFQDPSWWFQTNNHRIPTDFGAGIRDVIFAAFPELRSHGSMVDQYWSDLFARGLINTPAVGGMMGVSGSMSKRATALGEQFLRFITDPIQPSQT